MGQIIYDTLKHLTVHKETINVKLNYLTVGKSKISERQKYLKPFNYVQMINSDTWDNLCANNKYEWVKLF